MDLSQRLPRRNIHIQQPPIPIKLRPRNVLSLRYSHGRAAKIKPCHGGLDARIIDGTVLESWKSSFPPSAPPPPWQSLGRPRCWCQWGSARPRASSSTPASRSSGCRPLPAAGSTTVVDWLPRKSIDLPRKLLLDFLTGEEYVRHHTCHYQIIYIMQGIENKRENTRAWMQTELHLIGLGKPVLLSTICCRHTSHWQSHITSSDLDNWV